MTQNTGVSFLHHKCPILLTPTLLSLLRFCWSSPHFRSVECLQGTFVSRRMFSSRFFKWKIFRRFESFLHHPAVDWPPAGRQGVWGIERGEETRAVLPLEARHPLFSLLQRNQTMAGERFRGKYYYTVFWSYFATITFLLMKKSQNQISLLVWWKSSWIYLFILQRRNHRKPARWSYWMELVQNKINYCYHPLRLCSTHPLCFSPRMATGRDRKTTIKTVVGWRESHFSFEPKFCIYSCDRTVFFSAEPYGSEPRGSRTAQGKGFPSSLLSSKKIYWWRISATNPCQISWPASFLANKMARVK